MSLHSVSFASPAPLSLASVRRRRQHVSSSRSTRGPGGARRASHFASAGSGSGSSRPTLPGGFSAAEHSKERIRWADRVALQSQFGSAVDTLEVILAALRDNKTREDVGLPGDTRCRDEGCVSISAFLPLELLRAAEAAWSCSFSDCVRFFVLLLLALRGVCVLG